MQSGTRRAIPPFHAYLWQHLRLPLAALLAVTTIGTVGYRLIEGWSWLDSFYMTIITVSTVGYKEVHEPSNAGKLFTAGLILFGGVGVIAYAGFMLARVVLEEELNNILRGRRMLRDIEKLSGHIIVCGYGRNGRQAAESLSLDNVPVVAVDAEEEKLKAAPPRGVHLLQGDATEEEVLEQAGIARARGLITTLPKDADNVFVVLTAREMNPQARIVARANDEAAVSKLRRAGAHKVIVSDTIAGRRLASMLVRPTVMEFVNALTGGESGALRLEEFSLREGSPLVGKSLRECSVRERTGANIVGIKRGADPVLISLSADFVLASGDTLIALGQTEQVEKLGKML